MKTAYSNIRDKLISVVICTYNRCESLKDTLDSLLKQQCNIDYEIIVVDNNSKDKTKESVEFYIPKFKGRLIYVFEYTQGKSAASNRGIREAHGEIVAFVDDDVIVDKNWLTNISSEFQNPNIDCMGGKIYPIWETEKPDWLSERLFGRLALLDYGDKYFEIKSEDHELFGANIVFRKTCFEKYGLFDTMLGRKGDRLFTGEDTDYLNLLLKNKARVFYCPSLVVFHKIPKKRLKKVYFRRWHFDSGVSVALSDSKNGTKNNFGIPKYMIRKFLQSLSSFLLFSIKGNRKEAFFYECKIIFYVSYFINKLKLLIT